MKSEGSEHHIADRVCISALVGRGGFRTRPSDGLAVAGRLSSSLRYPLGFSRHSTTRNPKSAPAPRASCWLGEEDSEPGRPTHWALSDGFRVRSAAPWGFSPPPREEAQGALCSLSLFLVGRGGFGTPALSLRPAPRRRRAFELALLALGGSQTPLSKKEKHPPKRVLPFWLGVVDRFRTHTPEGSISAPSLRASGASM